MEVEANGLELGAMNKLLLEKIEELTLYILEQEKQQRLQKEVLQDKDLKIKALNKRLDKQERRLDALEAH
ncbi:MAG: hypothetical protein AAGA86_15280 [Bacteroidota bacterium]